MTRYEHTQTGHLIIWSLAGIAVFFAITGISARGGSGASMIVEGILLICALLFWKLTIKIDEQSLRWSFGIGIIRKRVPLNEIAGCEALRIRWWYGWGIHLTPYGWLYNVSGLDAVAITLQNGKKFALGTDDPHGFVEAIQRSITAN